MTDQWEIDLTCAATCAQCDAELNVTDQRILSVYTHQPTFRKQIYAAVD